MTEIEIGEIGEISQGGEISCSVKLLRSELLSNVGVRTEREREDHVREHPRLITVQGPF